MLFYYCNELLKKRKKYFFYFLVDVTKIELEDKQRIFYLIT